MSLGFEALYSFSLSSSLHPFPPAATVLLLGCNQKDKSGTVFSLVLDLSERSLIMLSDVSESDESSGESSGDWPWRYDDGKVFHIGGSKELKVELDNNNNISTTNLGLGGGNQEGSSSNDDDDHDQQQLVLLLKLKSLAAPSLDASFYFRKEIVSSCEGLVCMYDGTSNLLFYLWNPATKKHRILPKPKHFGADWSDHLFAFGYDVETKDYKVVLITGLRGMFYRPISPIERICRVQVYSLSTDSWRLLEGITCLPGEPFQSSNEALYVNGSCFFLANFFRTRDQPCFPESDRFIISFDFTKETITPIQLPDHHQDEKLYLSSLGDKLALFTKSSSNGNLDYNVWLLKEHNSIRSVNKESWTKLHSFQIEPTKPCTSYDPIGLSNDGEFALLETRGSSAFFKKIKLYHFATEEVKSFLSCNMVMSKAIAYKPSLVSIIGGNGAAAATTAPIG